MIAKSKSGESWAYMYGHRGQLTQASNGTNTVTYQYDAFGNRIERTANGTVEKFVVDGWDTSKPGAIGSENFDVVLDLDGSNAVTMRRVFGSGFDELVGRQDAAGAVLWYGTDHLGSVRRIFDNSGTVTNTVDFDAFGGFLGGVPADRYAYTGREFDSTLGLQYSRARMYDASIGRWLSEDPIGFAAGDVNLFRYVGNQPTGATDPSGLVSDDFKPVGTGLIFTRTYFWKYFNSDYSINLGELLLYKGKTYVRNGLGVVAIDLVKEAASQYADEWRASPQKMRDWFLKNNTDFTSTYRSCFIDEFSYDILKDAAKTTLNGANVLLIAYSVAMPAVGTADLLVRAVDDDVTAWDLAALLPLLPKALKAGAQNIYIAGKSGQGFAVPVSELQALSRSNSALLKPNTGVEAFMGQGKPQVMLNQAKYRDGFNKIFKKPTTSACVPNGVGVKLTREAGWNARDFSRKARALQDLAERGKLRKASGTAAMRTGAQGEYKNRLIRRAYEAYDRARADRLAARIRSMQADHIQDLQLSELDETSNLWLLDADVNIGLGRQIWQQIKDLPDGTIINNIEILGQ